MNLTFEVQFIIISVLRKPSAELDCSKNTESEGKLHEYRVWSSHEHEQEHQDDHERRERHADRGNDGRRKTGRQLLFLQTAKIDDQRQKRKTLNGRRSKHASTHQLIGHAVTFKVSRFHVMFFYFLLFSQSSCFYFTHSGFWHCTSAPRGTNKDKRTGNNNHFINTLTLSIFTESNIKDPSLESDRVIMMMLTTESKAIEPLSNKSKGNTQYLSAILLYIKYSIISEMLLKQV